MLFYIINRMTNKQDIKPVIRLTFKNENSDSHSEFGFGVYKLLLLTDELGSLNAAAKEMHMAYSKAWKLINSVEDAFQEKFAVKERPKGTHLTETGKHYLAMYRTILDSTSVLANKILNSENNL